MNKVGGIISLGGDHTIAVPLLRAINKKNGKTIIKIDKELFRPAEVELLIGYPGKAKRKLKWKPNTNLKKLVGLMVDYDLSQIKNTH